MIMTLTQTHVIQYKSTHEQLDKANANENLILTRNPTSPESKNNPLVKFTEKLFLQHFHKTQCVMQTEK